MRSKKEPFSDPDELDFCAFRCVRQGNDIVFHGLLLHDGAMTADDPAQSLIPARDRLGHARAGAGVVAG